MTILSPNEIAFVARPHWADKGLTGHVDGAGGFYSHLEISVAVALGESGGDTDIMGRSTTGAAIGNRDHGLWQVSNRWHQILGDGSPGRLLKAGSTWRDPFVNAKMAFEIWAEARAKGVDAWTPWHVYTSGSFKTYLPDARIACKAPWAPPTSQLAAIQSIVDSAVGKASDIEGARFSALSTTLQTHVTNEVTDFETAITDLVKKPHSITLTTQTMV